MKLGCRYSNSGCRMSSRLFTILIFFMDLKCGYLQLAAIKCDWSVQRWSLCPPYPTTDWHCLQAQRNCTAGEEYHCVRDESGEWTEICAKAITCSKGQEPVLKNSQIVCTNCRDSERYEPVEGTESYKYSECRRKKTTCPQDITHECPVDEAVRHSQDRQCSCDHKQDYMPQNYDLNTDTWVCKEPGDLNCIHVPCPEDVYGNQQTRTKDYRCIPLLSPITPTPSKKPTDRPSLPIITQTSTKSSRETGQTAETVSPPVWITIIGLLTGILVLLFAAAIVAFLLKKRNQLEKPDPPCELFVDTTNYTSLGLSWKSPENEKTCLLTGYVLDMKEAGDEFWKRVAKVSHGTTEFEVKDLKDGTAYLFQIAAKNKKGIGKFLVMKENACTKPFTCPSAPRNINGYFDKDNKHIKLEWEPPLDDGGLAITAFRVEYCNASDNKWKEAEPDSKDELSCNISRLVGGWIYKFRVQVSNEKGWGDSCELLEPLTYLSVPNKPTAVRIAKVESDKVILTWKAPKRDGGTAIKMYYVRTKHDGGESIITLEHKKRRENYNTEVPGLRPESIYYFGVCAVNDIGPGEFIETEDPTVLPKKIDVPGIPERVAKDPVPSYTDVILSWHRPKYDGGSPVTGFFVEEKRKNISEKRIGRTEPDKTDFHIKDLTAGKTYTFCIYAQNKIGNSKPLEVEVNTKPAKKPSKPSGPVQFTNVGLKQITISWGPSVDDGGSPIIGYCIDYFDSITQIWTEAVKCIKETTSTVTSLQEGREYVFHVRAINAKGESEPLESDVRTFLKQESGKGTDTSVSGEQWTSVDKGLPGQPTHLRVELRDYKLIVSWVAPDHVGGSKLDTYEVWIKANGSDWESVAVVKDTSRDFLGSKKHKCLVERITTGVRYYFRVSAKNKNGMSDLVETTTPVVLQEVKGKLVEVVPKRSTDSEVCSERSSSFSSQEVEDDQWAVQMKRKSSAGKRTESGDDDKPFQVKEEAFSSLQPISYDTPKQELPGSPEQLTTSLVGMNTVVLRWRPPENANTTGCTNFIIKNKEGENGKWVEVNVLKVDKLTYTIRDLPFKDMYFSVSAVNALGTGVATETKSPVTITYTRATPSIPVGPLTATHIGATEITLSWKPPEFSGTAPITHYFLFFEREDSDWDWLQMTSAEDTVCHITGLREKTSYQFKVTAENQWGQGDPLEMVEKVKTKTLQAPLPPSGPIEYTELTACSVRLIWKPPGTDASALTGYIIEYEDLQKTFTSWKNAGAVLAKHTTWVQHNLEQGHEYKFRVRSNNYKGTSEPLESEQLISPVISKCRNEDVGAGSSVDKTDETDELDYSAEDQEEKRDQKALDILEGTRGKDWNELLRELLDESIIKPILEESLKFPGEVSANILESATINIYKEGSKSLPHDFAAYEVPDNGNSLFNSVSLILFGSTNYSNRLRLAAALDGMTRLDSYIKQYFGGKGKKDVISLMRTFLSKTSAGDVASFESDDSSEIRELAMKMAVRETAMPESKCNPLQVQFLSTATGFSIKQHFEKHSETVYRKLNQDPDIIEPAESRTRSASEDLCIHILWVSDPKLRTRGSRLVNRVYPVIKKGKQVTTL